MKTNQLIALAIVNKKDQSKLVNITSEKSNLQFLIPVNLETNLLAIWMDALWCKLKSFQI